MPLDTKCIVLHHHGTFYIADNGVVAELSLRTLDDAKAFNVRLGAAATLDERHDIIKDIIVAVSHTP